MAQYEIVKIREHRELIQRASEWFHEKWRISQQAYFDSMTQSVESCCAVPQWYVVLDNESIIAGLGVIENDFHNRKDLSPNVCAVYVEKEYRCHGIAGEMLNAVCDDMKKLGTNVLYLITDHTSFYERYGWAFLCMVQGNDEPDMTRMYIHRAK